MQLFDIDGALSALDQKQFKLSLYKTIKAGKEAQVLLVKHDKGLLALKVYKNHLLRTFKKTDIYMTGKYIKKQSHRKAVEQKNKFGKQYIQDTWVMREFHLLQKIYTIKATIPQPIAAVTNAILMEFIGSKDIPAPKLIDVQLDYDQAPFAFENIVNDMRLFLQAGIVHSDLSPFNILWWKNLPYIIDFPQAVDIRTNPNTEEMLRRDIHNISTYFTKHFPINEEDIFQQLKDLL